MNNEENKPVSLNCYKSDKIKMLQKHFLVNLKPEQIEHLNSLKSEIAVDNYARSLMYS